MRYFGSFVFLSFAFSAFAETPVSFGVKGGFLLSDTNTGYNRNEDRWYTVGPSVEFRLPRNFAVEFNPLYKRTGYTKIDSDLFGSFYLDRVRENRWEFPLLGKYYFGPVFAAGGYTARRSAATSDRYHIIRRFDGAIGAVINEEADLGTETEQGFALGGGARFRLFGPLKISAEYRYSRWVTADLITPRKTAPYGPTKNQHEILIGFTF
jgi:opacity protein-like surface antigen